MYVEKLCQNDAAWLREIFAGGRSRGESERENGRGERASQTIQVINDRVTYQLSSGEPKPIFSARGQHWKIFVEDHHLR